MILCSQILCHKDFYLSVFFFSNKTGVFGASRSTAAQKQFSLDSHGQDSPNEVGG